MTTVGIVVTAPDGRVHRVDGVGERLTIGAGEGAGLTVASVDWMQSEHILVAPRGDQCWVSVAASGPAAQANGAPFSSGYLPWNSSVRVGDLRVDLQRLTSSPAGRTSNRDLGRALLLLLGLAGLALTLYGRRAGSEAAGGLPPVPPLFEQPEGCGEGSPEHIALSAADAGDARRVRYVFVPQDGVAAVTHYRRAALCFERAGRGDLAAEMTEAAEDLGRRIEFDLQRGLLALERALGDGDVPRARAECHLLLQVLAHRERSELYLRLRALSMALAARVEQEGGER